jgi:glycosyltransferase involved in cell wall biosynthesis
MPGISAVVIAFQEAGRIGDAVRSVRPWVDEVLVLDGGSRDATVAEAVAAGARVERHPFDGFVAQKQRATDLAAHDLVFALDADERIDEPLGAALAGAADRPGGAVAWRVRRLNYLDGRPLRASGWYPDRRIRLFDRRRARWTGHDPHDRVEADGPVADLPGHLHHDPERTTRSYAEGTRAHAKRRAEGLADRRPGALAPLLHGAGHLARKLTVGRAWLDGRRGMTVALVGARGVALKYKLARQLAAGRPPEERP